MIKKLHIKNFKSLEDVSLDCSNLNVLTGLNGMGKSSIIQALLLLRQSHEKGMLKQTGLALRGDIIEVGTTKDILFSGAGEDKISFEIDFVNEDDSISTKNWDFSSKIDITDYSNSDYLPVLIDAEDYESYHLFDYNTFKYLNADRWVKNEYETSDFNVVRNRYLGKHGEFTAHYLTHYGSEKIHDDLIFPGGKQTNELLTQVSEWMAEISPNLKVKTERLSGTNTVKLRYEYTSGQTATPEITPLNLGFGITYILPVVVALLSAKKGDLIIIENPESHIHPKGQSIIGGLLAKVAQTGVQIFLETHSDHIINGILVSVYKNFKNIEKGIESNNIKINFVKRIEDSIASEVLQLNVEVNGRMRGIPDDFFDQYSKDMKTIMGF